MNQDEATLEKIAAEVEYGNLLVTIVAKKIVSIPKQRVERPRKIGVDHDIVIPEPIRLSA